MMRSLFTLTLILVFLALAACTPGSAQVAQTNSILTTIPAHVTPAMTPAPTLTTTAAPSRTATLAPSATPTPAATWTPLSAATPTATATALPPMATSTPEGPAVQIQANANLRSGPGTAYPVIGAARTGQLLPVLGQTDDWWQIALAGRTGWIWSALVAPNAAAAQAPEVSDFPPVEVKAEVEAEPVATPTSTSTLTSATPLPDLVVLGPDTQYPVRARVIRGWDYEFVDLSAVYDIVVYRDVFGMLAHQIDDENIRRYYPNKRRLGASGPIRVTLVDAQPHPDAGCPGWGWAPERETYSSDPLGLMQDRCLVQHSLRPVGDGHGAVLLVGWSSGVGNTVAVGGYGPTGANWSTTYFAELIVWPASLGPADRPDFTQPLYQPLGAAQKADGRWVWRDAFVQIVPAGR